MLMVGEIVLCLLLTITVICFYENLITIFHIVLFSHRLYFHELDDPSRLGRNVNRYASN